LQSFSVIWSGLYGPLPVDLLKMKHLVSLELHFNRFTGTGTILLTCLSLLLPVASFVLVANNCCSLSRSLSLVPEEWWSARNLQQINIGRNLLVGTIPPAIENLKDLKGIYLFKNLFTGTLPEELGNLESLSYIRATHNYLVGTIPSSIGMMKSLEEFWLHFNEFTGQIPTEVGLLNSTLDDLRLHGNSMTGQLPGTILLICLLLVLYASFVLIANNFCSLSLSLDELYSVTTLSRLDLYGNNFTGTISPSIANWGGQMGTLRISDNHFSGKIPVEMASLETLGAVWYVVGGSRVLRSSQSNLVYCAA
jgi:hypothetical protein